MSMGQPCQDRITKIICCASSYSKGPLLSVAVLGVVAEHTAGACRQVDAHRLAGGSGGYYRHGVGARRYAQLWLAI